MIIQLIVLFALRNFHQFIYLKNNTNLHYTLSLYNSLGKCILRKEEDPVAFQFNKKDKRTLYESSVRELLSFHF